MLSSGFQTEFNIEDACDCSSGVQPVGALSRESRCMRARVACACRSPGRGTHVGFRDSCGPQARAARVE